MTTKTDILFRQSEELSTLRERSIENIISSSNAFLTFLGLAATALAVFIDYSKPTNTAECIDRVDHIVLIFAGCAIFQYGRFIYHHIWSFYINQIIYTRKMNLTRAYLTKGQNISKRILLPTKGNIPSFDDQGHLGEKFSKKGVVCWIKWVNTIVMFLSVFAFVMLGLRIPNINDCIKVVVPITSLIFAFIVGRSTFIKHEDDDEDILKKAENIWLGEIQCKENWYD